MAPQEETEDENIIRRAVALLAAVAVAVGLSLLFASPCDPPPGEPAPAASGGEPAD